MVACMVKWMSKLLRKITTNHKSQIFMISMEMQRSSLFSSIQCKIRNFQVTIKFMPNYKFKGNQSIFHVEM